ncbi:MAG: dienelactone hydrolase family protein [Hyphomonas sp.]
MVFGGAYHRGSRGDFHYVEDGAQDSSMADYCRMFAANGIACFAIDYRLTPEDPALPQGARDAVTVPKALLEDPVSPPASLSCGSAWACHRLMRCPGTPTGRPLSRRSKTSTALDHVRQNAAAYGVAPNRIAIGGFPAGAITAINLAYGEGADVSAVVSLSGSIWGYDVTQTARRGQPPLLLFAGQQDLPGIRWGNAELAKQFAAKGMTVETAWVPGFGHFYPMGAPSLGPGFSRLSAEQTDPRFPEPFTGLTP